MVFLQKERRYLRNGETTETDLAGTEPLQNSLSVRNAAARCQDTDLLFNNSTGARLLLLDEISEGLAPVIVLPLHLFKH
jgi:hypothetical protein